MIRRCERDLEHSYSRDLIPNRIGLNVTIRAVIERRDSGDF